MSPDIIAPTDAARETRIGLVYALTASFLWGFNPVYYYFLDHVPATEIIIHRGLWSVGLCAVLVTLRQRWSFILSILSDRKLVGFLFVTGLIIGGNWFLFIWSVTSNRVLEASLGYYINPLVSVVLGMVFLGERLTRLQSFAVGLATIGVLYQTIALGAFPWVSVTLAVSFGIYGYLRKIVVIDSLDGLFVEVLLLAPVLLGAAFVLFGYTSFYQGIPFLFPSSDLTTKLLLISTSLVTAAPLLLFVSGAKRLKLTTVGICMYLVPSLQFLCAITLFNEALTTTHFVTFGFIWTALIVYTWDSFRREKSI